MRPAKVYACPRCARSWRTQLDFVEHLLVEAGRTGITTDELLAAGAGNRFGARVDELRNDRRLVIDCRPDRGTYRYTLRPVAIAGFETGWLCVHCGHPSVGAHSQDCCDDKAAIRLRVLDRLLERQAA